MLSFKIHCLVDFIRMNPVRKCIPSKRGKFKMPAFSIHSNLHFLNFIHEKFAHMTAAYVYL